MAARLGDVLYWAFSGVALVLIAWLALVVINNPPLDQETLSTLIHLVAGPASAVCIAAIGFT